jgi:hypothetical protein
MTSLIAKVTSSITFLAALALVLFYLVAGEAIKAAAPIVVWVVLGVGAVAGAVRLWFLYDAHRLQNQAIRAETAEKVTKHRLLALRAVWELERDRVLATLTAQQMAAGLVHASELGATPSIRAFPTGTAKQAEKVLPGEAAAAMSLLAALTDCDNILVVGGKGTGKTSLLQHLEAQRSQTGRTVILDSHAQPAQWRGYLVGLGRNYERIREMMITLTDKLNQRYQTYATGQSQFEPIYTIIDEFTLLPKVLKEINFDVKAYSIPALTEGRKVGINCMWGVHSDRVTALGLEGASDVRECFDAIVHLKNVNGQRYGLIDYGEGKLETRFVHPGPFRNSPEPAATSLATLPETTENRPSIFNLPVAGGPAEMAADEPDETEAAVIEAWNESRSLSACYRAWHLAKHGRQFEGRCNGDKLNMMKAILEKWDVEKF